MEFSIIFFSIWESLSTVILPPPAPSPTSPLFAKYVEWKKRSSSTSIYVVKGEADQPTKYNLGGGSFVVNGSDQRRGGETLSIGIWAAALTGKGPDGAAVLRLNPAVNIKRCEIRE